MAMTSNVTLRGTSLHEGRFTFNLVHTLAAGVSTDTLMGLAVSIDTTANNAVHLAGDGEAIIGAIFGPPEVDMQGNMVCTVDTLGGIEMQVLAADPATRGTTPVGAGGGKIKAGPSLTDKRVWIASNAGLTSAARTATVMFL